MYQVQGVRGGGGGGGGGDSAMLHNFGFGWRIGLKFCRNGPSSNCGVFH